MNLKENAEFNPRLFLAKLGEGRSIADYLKNRMVFSQGDPSDSVWYIRKGKLKLTVVSPHGKEAVLGILGVGEFFGEGCLVGQPLRMATAMTISQCSLIRFEKTSMLQVLQKKSEFSSFFLGYLLSRNIRLEEDLLDQLFNSSEKRLARALLLLANFDKEGKPEPVILKVSQETLANMIGTTRSRVSFFMTKFRKLGLIDYKCGLAVHNSLLSIVLHD